MLIFTTVTLCPGTFTSGPHHLCVCVSKQGTDEVVGIVVDVVEGSTGVASLLKSLLVYYLSACVSVIHSKLHAQVIYPID